ncbi:MAG: hypothetical protein KAS66_05180 [Candidatus Omnitrophica bacterium]|nr:hypothetical protein [Candidatus Omnitrophota bacterium]
MQPGELMFKIHGSLGPCPKPPLPKEKTELEQLREENELLWQLLAPFALFAKPAALEIAGGDPDKIGKSVIQHENQALCWGAFLMAREEWEKMIAEREKQ